MKSKVFFVVAVLLSLLSAPARADGAWNVTTSGTIQSGYDATGIWGVAGSLAGLAYTQSIIANINVEDWRYFESNPELHQNRLSGTGTAFLSRVTINGKTVTFYSGYTMDGNQTISSHVSQAGPGGGYDYVSSSQASVGLFANNYAISTKIAFVATSAFGQNISLTDISSDDFTKYSSLLVSQPGVYAEFSAVPDFISVSPANYVPSPVPEPATYAIFLTGLGLVGALARRRKRAGILHSD